MPNPFHPFVPPFEYHSAEGTDGSPSIYDSEGDLVLTLTSPFSKMAINRIGSHIADLMNASAVLAEHEEKV